VFHTVFNRPVAKGAKGDRAPAKSECPLAKGGEGKETRGGKGVVPLFQCIVPPRFPWASYGPALSLILDTIAERATNEL
jgi:hypothetical protein